MCQLSSQALSVLPQHWCNIVQFEDLPPVNQTHIANVVSHSEPTSFQEASKDPKWIEAMNQEIQALQQNKTWILTDLRPNKKAIGNKWVYKAKLRSDGSIERNKARLVIQGNHQKYGIDYSETFSPVVKMSTIRTVIALAASMRWDIHQLDINNAFLHGELDEDVYMKVPAGIPNPHNKVCKLLKFLCGLKQASRQWFAKLSSSLTQQGYMQSKCDYSLFLKKHNNHLTIVAIYVDDILVTGSDMNEVQAFKATLHDQFTIKDLGLMHYFLGIEATYVPDGIILSQKKFTKELLEEINMTYSKPALTPLPQHLHRTSDAGSLLPHPTIYRTLVGKLNYLTHTRPDLSFSVQALSQYMQEPRSSHMEALEHLLRSVKGTAGQGILMHGSKQLSLHAYSDSDWATCVL